MTFMTNLRAGEIRGMLVTTQFMIFYKNVIKIEIHRAVILPVILYGYGMWSHPNRLRMFEDGVLALSERK
jgi:hypothetical protein